MKRRKFLVSLLLALLMLPLHVFAEEPTYAFTDAEVLARGQLYYSSLNQFSAMLQMITAMPPKLP